MTLVQSAMASTIPNLLFLNRNYIYINYIYLQACRYTCNTIPTQETDPTFLFICCAPLQTQLIKEKGE